MDEIAAAFIKGIHNGILDEGRNIHTR